MDIGQRPARRAVLLAGLSLALSGCALDLIGLGGRPPLTFDLAAPAKLEKRIGSSRAHLLIAEPRAVSAYATERVVVRVNASEVNYLARSQWTDQLPRLVQARLAETFENSSRIRAVVRPGDGVVVDYQLLVEIRRFEYDSVSGTAEVELFLRMLNDRAGRIVASEQVAASAHAAGDDAKSVVAALNLAFAKAASDTVAWSLARI